MILTGVVGGIFTGCLVCICAYKLVESDCELKVMPFHKLLCQMPYQKFYPLSWLGNNHNNAFREWNKLHMTMEIGGAVYGAYIVYCCKNIDDLFAAGLLAFGMMVLSCIDYIYQVVPDAVLIIMLMLAWSIFDIDEAMLISMLTAFIVFIGIYIMTKAGIGMGDVKLAIVLGAWLSLDQLLLAIWLAFAAGGLYGLIACFGFQCSRKTAIPFVPFMTIGTLSSYLWGNTILELYWDVF